MAKAKTNGTGRKGGARAARAARSAPAKPLVKARRVTPKPRAEAPKRVVKLPARKAGPAKAVASLAPTAKPKTRPAPKAKASARKPVARAAAPAQPAPPKRAVARVALTEEERIEEAKYLPRDLPKRLFEEERFIFPESYGVTRLRLLVKDPDWLFAHWDVDPKTLASLHGEVGERAMALSRLTLRIADPEQGGQKTILLPPGARSWYVRADGRRARAYVAELGVTLPSGQFRRLAESNQVVTPRVGPSSEVARERKRVARTRESGAAESGAGASVPGPSRASASRGRAGKREPWRPSPEHLDARDAGKGGGSAEEGPASAKTARGGASDVFRPAGASDVHRR
jgi:hypothetical protein